MAVLYDGGILIKVQPCESFMFYIFNPCRDSESLCNKVDRYILVMSRNVQGLGDILPLNEILA